LRFVRQLMEDESTAWMWAEPAVARGAVRLAPAEVRSGVQSTATGLLSVNALRRALGERAGGRGARSGSERRWGASAGVQRG
jgi:hypothetical protein